MSVPDEEVSAAPPTPGVTTRTRVLWLVGLAIVLVGTRLLTYHEPLDRDVTTYAVVAHELADGRALYSDLWDHKPPAVFAAFWLAERVTGYGPAEVFLVSVATALATLLLVYAVTRSLAGDARAGLWGAALWAAVASDAGFQANQPNVEAFLNPLLLAVLLLFLGAQPGRSEFGRCAAVGAIVGLAGLFKPVAFLPAAALVAAHAASAFRERRSRRSAVVQTAVVFISSLAVVAVAFAWFAASGRAAALIDAVFTYNRFYAGSQLANILWGLTPRFLVPRFFLTVMPLLTVAVTGVIFVLRRRPSRNAILFVAYAASVPLAVAWPGKYAPHYYQLWLPVVAIGAAWVMSRISIALNLGARRAAALKAVVLFLTLWPQIPSFLWSPAEWSRFKYGSIFVDSERAAAVIRDLLRPEETFYQWGAETGLYFYSGRRPASGVIYNLPLLSGPLAGRLSQRVVADLESSRPELVVVSPEGPRPEGQPVLAWLAGRYVEIAAPRNDTPFVFFARRGTRLADRYAGEPRSEPSRIDPS